MKQRRLALPQMDGIDRETLPISIPRDMSSECSGIGTLVMLAAITDTGHSTLLSSVSWTGSRN